MLNIAVLVSGGGTNLQALIDAEKAGKIENGRISVVVASKPGVYALERARNAGIEGVVLARKDFESVDDYSAALARGVKVSGATVHFVNEVCDGGPIILQKAVPVEPGDTPETLQRRIMEQAEWQLLPEAVSLFCAGRLSVDGAVVTIKDK